MKNKISKSLAFLFLTSLLLFSCKKDNDKPNNSGSDKRKVKYELSGNFTGKLLVVTSTNTGALQQFNGVALPWTKEIQYDKNVMAAGAGVQTENENRGVAGQTFTLKVYINNKLKDTKTVTADANGMINISMAFYTF